MIYLNEAEIQLGKENYEIGNYWHPTAYEYQARQSVHQTSPIDDSPAAQGIASQPRARSRKPVKGTSNHIMGESKI